MKNIFLWTAIVISLWKPGYLLAKSSISTRNESIMVNINKQMVRQMPGSLENIRHKIPSAAIVDNSINMQNISTNVVQDLFVELTGKYSTLSVEDLNLRNYMIIDILDNIAKYPTSSGVTFAAAKGLAVQALQHEVVGLASKTKNKYDPVIKGVRKHGFCFGRADFVYFKLRAMGVERSSIFKLFQVGLIAADLRDFGRPWINHNVSIVRANEGGWYAIDPFYMTLGLPGVMSLKKWYEINRSFIKNKKSLLFVSQPERVNVQGGTFLRESIRDKVFPVVRMVKIGSTEPKVIEIKDKNYLKYYSDMILSLSNDLTTKKIVCEEANWCAN